MFLYTHIYQSSNDPFAPNHQHFIPQMNDQELISKGLNIKMFKQTSTNTEAEGNC